MNELDMVIKKYSKFILRRHRMGLPKVSDEDQEFIIFKKFIEREINRIIMKDFKTEDFIRDLIRSKEDNEIVLDHDAFTDRYLLKYKHNGEWKYMEVKREDIFLDRNPLLIDDIFLRSLLNRIKHGT